MSKTLKTIGTILSILAFAALIIWVDRKLPGWPKEQPAIVRDTVKTVEYIHDTIRLAASEAVGTEQATLPLVAVVPQPPSPVDSSVVAPEHPPAAPDSATVEIPIERRTYEGENYRAVVEGYNPKLVDIWIAAPTTTITEVRTKTKHWSVTIGPQVGYGFTPKGWQPYAGIGVTFGYTF